LETDKLKQSHEKAIAPATIEHFIVFSTKVLCWGKFP